MTKSRFGKKAVAVYMKALILFINANIGWASEIHYGSDKSCTDANNVETPEKHGGLYGFGGQIRLRGDYVKNQNLGDFGFSPGTEDKQIISRTRGNLSLNPTENLKGFIEGQYYLRANHEDLSQPNLYQAYMELAGIGQLPIDIKLGRQEFCYGSTFFLGANDFYEGLVWDGVKMRYKQQDKLWIDIIGARFVRLDKNVSDDEPALYGAYSSYTLKEDTNVDLYFFYHKGGFQFFHNDMPDSSSWYTLGARAAGKVYERFDYEIEPLYQFGSIDNMEQGGRDVISAYGGHLDLGYTFDVDNNGRIFTAYAFGSGDNNTRDGKFREFHGNIYNDNFLVGDTSIVPDLSGIDVGDFRASGMHVFVAGVSKDLNPKLNVNLDYHYFLADKTPAGFSKDIGSEVNLIFSYKIEENLNLILGVNRFLTGGFFADAGGSDKDIDYIFIQTQLDF